MYLGTYSHFYYRTYSSASNRRGAVITVPLCSFFKNVVKSGVSNKRVGGVNFKKITGEEVLRFKCRVADKKAVRASGINGLQIRVIINITLTKKKIVILRKQFAKISDCCLIL